MSFNHELLISAVYKNMETMLKQPCLYIAEHDTDMWEVYLEAIPPEHNPIFLKNRTYDCNCCKAFIRRAGNIVTVNDDLTLHTIWDINVDDPICQAIADTLKDFVKYINKLALFVTYESTIGSKKSLRELPAGAIVQFDHLYSPPIGHHVKVKDAIGTLKSDFDSSVSVFTRALREIPIDVVDTVLDLINDDTLYRGEQHKRVLQSFKKVQESAGRTPANLLDRCVIKAMEQKDVGHAVIHIRNTSIGTLLVDLSTGMDLEQAVRRYETVTAPTNYKRSKSLVTKKMVDDARRQIQELGLLPAFSRRHAVMADLNVKDLIFVDRAHDVGTDDMFSVIETKVSSNPKGAETISIQDFIHTVVNRCTRIEVKLSREHMANSFNLTTAVDGSSPFIFKWTNHFGWSYKGGVADSLRERVKKAGGVVDAPVCVRLAWDDNDDLDLHLRTNDVHVHYGAKRGAGFALDIDANAGGGKNMEFPVENIYLEDLIYWRSRDATCSIFVENFAHVDSDAQGFEIEVTIDGQYTYMTYDKMLSNKERIDIGKLVCTNGQFTFVPSIPTVQKVRTVNGVIFGDFVPVIALSLSPNYWEGQDGIGNPHHFFYLKNYVTDENVRTIYNEFLRDDLRQHRKVLEILAAKTQISPEAEQLGGLGFSASVRNSIIARVTVDGKQRLYDVQF